MHSSNIRSPARVGPYLLLRKLAVGGTSSVYVGRHVGIGVDAAVKVLDPELSRSVDARRRFRREAVVLARLDDPAIPRSRGASLDEGYHYIAMDLVRGYSLHDLLRHRPLSPENAARCCHDIASALAHAHAAGVVHGDVKPENVLIDEHGAVKLIDFGLARDLQEPLESLPEAGVGYGTPWYMAPEQWRGSAVDGRADVYGLGVLLFRALTLDVPYPGATPMEVFEAQSARRPRRLSDHRAHIDPLLVSIVERATRLDPRQRFASAHEMAMVLANYCRPRARRESVAPARAFGNAQLTM